MFRFLGVQPALGRFFTATEDQPGANATVVLTWGLWKRRFGGDPGIVGRSILIDAKRYTVLGILPAWFTWPDPRVQFGRRSITRSRRTDADVRRPQLSMSWDVCVPG